MQIYTHPATDLQRKVAMKTFCYRIKDESGIHARPAGMIVRLAEKFESNTKIEKDGMSVDLKKLLSVMQLGVLCNETVKITIEGTDEEDAFRNIKSFFEENL